jgi:acetyl esterase/lipase
MTQATYLAFALTLSLFLPTGASAGQLTDSSARSTKPRAEASISLPAPPRPAGMRDESVVTFGSTRIVMNVSAPTLTPVLPPSGTANGTAVIVAPGGGFSVLALDLEGYDQAQWLAAHGITAFVLSYRLKPRSGDLAAMAKEDAGRFRPDMRFDAFAPAVADAQAAMKLVRTRAAQWGIDPKRVGMMGFSAGASAAIATSIAAETETRPDFLISVYGPLQEEPVPRGAPPLYGIIAFDDPVFAGRDFGLLQSWRKAGSSIEFHFYERGGHGFGMGRAGTTTSQWIEGALKWMRMRGIVPDVAPTGRP